MTRTFGVLRHARSFSGSKAKAATSRSTPKRFAPSTGNHKSSKNPVRRTGLQCLPIFPVQFVACHDARINVAIHSLRTRRDESNDESFLPDFELHVGVIIIRDAAIQSVEP